MAVSQNVGQNGRDRRTYPVTIDVKDSDEVRPSRVVPHETCDSGHVLCPSAVIRRLRREELDDGCGQSL